MLSVCSVLARCTTCAASEEGEITLRGVVLVSVRLALRMLFEFVDGNKGISGSYPPSVVVNINTSMTINPLAASNGNQFTHGGSPTYYNDKSAFYPGAQSSYASTTDQTKDLKQETILLTLPSLVNILLNEKSSTGI